MPYKSSKIRLPQEYDRRRKLTDEQKEQIRKEYSVGDTSWNKLAVKYHVSKRTIGLIVNENSMENMKIYRKEHWKDFQHSREEMTAYAKNWRNYKQDLYLKGILK